MNADLIWIVVAGLVALWLVTRMRSRRRTESRRRRPSAGPRIQGFQVTAYVHPRMSAACLADHGVQFGKGFRRKEGPALPHDEACRCEAIPFAFTSREVFNGALRRVGQVRSSIEGLSPTDGQLLIERLRAVEVNPPPAEPEAYIAAVGPERFPEEVQPALRAFLGLRHAYLLEREPPSGPESVTPEPIESSEPT